MKKAKTILLISAFLLTFIVTKQINVMQDTQIWKAVPSYLGNYEVSNTGLIRNSKGKILKTYLRNESYFWIKLSKNQPHSIHRLVAIAFVDNPIDKPQVNHINGIKTDNRAVNLEWVTCSENRSHSFKIGINCNLGSKNPSVKLDEKKVLQIRMKRKRGYTFRRISEEYDISQSQVQKIVNRERWSHI